MTESVILIVDDLMFLPKLQQGVRHLGYTPLEATDEANLTRALFQSPVLVIVDLFSQSFDWEDLIALIKKSKAGPVPVLGFGPHVDLALRERALAAGCNAVVGRGAIAGKLPGLIDKHKWRLNTSRCTESPPAKLLEGIDLFNRGRYFDCHEEIELAWNDEPEPVRIMYQGILQIGVACYHIENKNWRGAMKLLQRGMPKLRRFAPACMGIDLAQLLADSEALQQELVRVSPEWKSAFDTSLFPTITINRSRT